MKYSNMCIIRVPAKRLPAKVLDEIMSKISIFVRTFLKDSRCSKNSKTNTPKKENPLRNQIPRHIIIRFLKTSDKEKMLKAASE